MVTKIKKEFGFTWRIINTRSKNGKWIESTKISKIRHENNIQKSMVSQDINSCLETTL